MTKEECVRSLIYLIEKYVPNEDEKIRLLSVNRERSESPPAKGVVYAIFKAYNGKFSADDKALIDEISFFFG
jgi:hypothetical protein